MGFFSDFIGSLTGANERRAGRDAAAGFERGIQFTKDEIAKSRAETKDLMRAAFENIQTGLEASLPIPQQTLAAQLQLLGAGTEALSPEGPTNALRRATAAGNNILLGRNNATAQSPMASPTAFTAVSATPFNVEAPKFKSPLLGK